MSLAIKLEDISKAYQIGQIGTGTISRDLERWWVTRVLGREDPFLKVGQINDRTVKGDSDVVWSLRDINYTVEKGAAVGIIGRNGAGKTTLLKLLSRITSPTTGTIKVKGRIASLLEVGTGFHQELTGRENIYLNGSILGMRRKEINRKLDEIIDFSGVERYIDTPVKRYSIGMQVRLAFAIAAHLESEILIVDEVLAVGDLEFQKKCLGKMEDVGKKEGRTVLFVSHNLSNIKRLCNTGLLLLNGRMEKIGDIDTVLDHYTESITEATNGSFVEEFSVENPNLVSGEKLHMSIRLAEDLGPDAKLLLRIKDQRNINIIRFEVVLPDEGFDRLVVETEGLDLTQGVYHVEIGSTNTSNLWLKRFVDVGKFNVVGVDKYGIDRVFTNEMAIVTPDINYHFEK